MHLFQSFKIILITFLWIEKICMNASFTTGNIGHGVRILFSKVKYEARPLNPGSGYLSLNYCFIS